MHGPNAAVLNLPKDMARKHPTLPVSLLKPFTASDKDKFPLRKDIQVTTPPDEISVPGDIKAILKQKLVRHRGKDTRL